MTQTTFPALTNFEPTRQTLQWYSHAVGVVPRAHAEFHPEWYHISLKVVANGLRTNEMPLPAGGSFHLMMDLRNHMLVLNQSSGESQHFSMMAGLTSTEFGEQLLDAVGELGLTADYAHNKFKNDDPRDYDPAAATQCLVAFSAADRIFKKHRATLNGKMGPVQVWGHGFDIAFEWFGTRVETSEENGEIKESRALLNLGFYPGDPQNEPYFYSNPWPFEGDTLLKKELPEGARWFTESWQGSILPYAELVGDPNAEARLLTYAQAVFAATSPTLLV